jgi:polysaccharide biosynthesis transport protein
MKMCGAGLGTGIGLGILVVALLELLDDRLHSDKEIEKLLPIAVISEVPEILSPVEEGLIQRRFFRGWAMAATVMVIILVGATVSYLRA